MGKSRLTQQPLVLAWGTLASAPFPDRVAAAAAGGFASIGMMLGDYVGMRRDGWTDAAISELLDEHDLTISEVEVLFGFHGPSGSAGIVERPGLVYADPELEAIAFHMSDVFGVRHVQAVGRFAEPLTDLDDASAAFAELCDRAAAHALKVALEFVPYTDIPNIKTATQIVRTANRANGGLCVDSWHFFRGDPDFEALRVAASRVFMIQLNDGALRAKDPNPLLDAVHHRRLPGEGEFDLVTFLCAMDISELDASVSVEVYSDTLQAITPHEVGGRAAASTRAVLRAAAHQSLGP